jgi:hypothetical protein
MTEAEWWECANLIPMMNWALDQTSERKLRLFACACCRRVGRLIKDERAKKALAFAEQLSDRGQAGRKGRPAVDKDAREACEELWRVDQAPLNAAELLAHLAESNATHAAQLGVAASAQLAAQQASSSASLAAAYATCRTPKVKTLFPACREERIEAESREQVRLLRDIIGNPFRPVALAAALQTPTIVSLARAAYDERDLPSGILDIHRLAVLADAVEEAGAPGELVAHLRGPGPHVRGCWPVDLCLGLN